MSVFVLVNLMTFSNPFYIVNDKKMVMICFNVITWQLLGGNRKNAKFLPGITASYMVETSQMHYHLSQRA
jgi:hypothetical protein